MLPRCTLGGNARPSDRGRTIAASFNCALLLTSSGDHREDGAAEPSSNRAHGDTRRRVWLRKEPSRAHDDFDEREEEVGGKVHVLTNSVPRNVMFWLPLFSVQGQDGGHGAVSCGLEVGFSQEAE